MVKLKMLVLSVLIAIPILVAQQKEAAPYEKGVVVDGNGDLLQWHRWAGYPPKDYVPQGEIDKSEPKALVMIPDIVPAYDWAYGCTATATAMISAFYDNYGADNVYIGPENSGVAPMTSTPWEGQSSQSSTVMNPIAASKSGVDGRGTRGHGDDYWTDYLDEATDPYYGNWTEHNHNDGQRCTADFMGTNQWYNWENADGSTAIFNYEAPTGRKLYDMPDQDNGDGTFSRDGCHGWRLFFESIGMTVDENYNQLVDGYDDPDDDPDGGPVVDGYTFADYKASIDAGIPVLIHVIGHSIVGYGYDESYSPPRVYIRSTWNTDTSHDEYFSWGGEFSGMQHYSMSALHLAPKEYYSVPQNVLALNDNRTVTVNWDDPSEGTRNLSYIVYRDGAQIATTANTTYSETLDSSYDGVHGYSVKAVYTDPDPDVTSYMSVISEVFVCESVTSFYDDFEDTWAGQWLMNPASGSATNAWGRASTPTYQGSYSLADSPSGDYDNDSDQLAAGGHIAEVAPGLNFSTAADATMSFWLNYSIEESFDYLHLQATEDGTTWTTLKTWSSEAYWGTWNFEEIALGMYAGSSNVRFRFIMVTDPGYVTNGAYIDNFSIQPSTEDTTPPYVYYEKEKDFFTEWPNGHWLETRIVDYTGVDYARILYKVNGGTEQTLNPSAVNGEYYQFQFPDLTDGDMVEFRFDCQDTFSPANQGYKGPFYYVHGLHQKYDYGKVSFYSEVGPNSTDGTEGLAVRFSSYYDDVLGVIVRGYTDQDADPANSQMEINVWADDGTGLPGATMITPFNVDNPATLSETNKFAYVDLSSYTALQSLVDDFFVGIRCPSGQTGVTRTTMTDTAVEGEFCFDRSYYDNEGWAFAEASNYHVRLVTTNKEVSPPIIDPSPTALAETLPTDGTSSGILTISNPGGFDLDYSASFNYTSTPAKEKATITVESNNFDSGLGYTSSGGITWTATGGQAVLNADTGGNPNGSTSGTLTSGTFDGTQCTALTLDFDQTLTGSSSSVTAEYYDGTQWNSVFSSGTSGSSSPSVELPVLSANMQIRFTGDMGNRSGDSWSIDNVVVSGPEVIALNWLTLDAGTTTGALVVPDGSDDITVGYDATGLTVEGDYMADITFTAPDAETVHVLATLTVDNNGGTPPDVPANVVTSISGTDLVIDWDVSANATGYDVYGSDDPYGTFSFVTSVATEQYTVPADQAKMFYYIVATNSSKALNKKTIKISKDGSIR